jgi:phenylacetate-CoA ligase
MNQNNMADYIKTIQLHKPTAIISYVNPIFELSKFILKSNVKIQSPKAILTGAEPLYEFQREKIEQAFGCPVYNTFGCREFMLIAAECSENKALHINIDHLVVETVDEEHNPISDRSGDLIITDLHNYGMPLIRYANGDRATLSSNRCGCGNPLPIIKSIDGRKLDVIKTPSGGLIPGELFPHMFKDFRAIDKFQVHQKDINNLLIKIIAPNGLSDNEKQQIKDEVNKYAQDELSIYIQLVDKISSTAAGKHRVTISDI